MLDPAGLPTIFCDKIDTLLGPRAKDNEEIGRGGRPSRTSGASRAARVAVLAGVAARSLISSLGPHAEHQ
jgi:hypothetical protein